MKSKHFKMLKEKAEKLLANHLGVPPDEVNTEEYNIYKLIHELSTHQIELEIQNEELCQTQLELEESRNRYIDLYEYAPICYITLSNQGIIYAANRVAAELLNTKKEWLYGKNFCNFIADASLNQFEFHIKNLLRTGERQRDEIEIICINKYCYTQMESVLAPDNQIRMSLTDLTYRREAESKLLEFNKSLHLVNNLFQNLNEGMAALDADFRFIVMNNYFIKAFARLFNANASPGANLFHIIWNNSTTRTMLSTMCKDVLLGKEACKIIENLNSAEEFYCYEIHIKPIQVEQVNELGLAFHIRDITKEKNRERLRSKQNAELSHVTRINIMGEMASAMAHEINQPLAVIRAYSQGCLQLKDELKQAKLPTALERKLFTALEQMEAQSAHAGEVTHRMKNFIREGVIYPVRIDINNLITEVLFFLNYELVNLRVHVTQNLAKNLPQLYIDKTQISQVMINIIRNSIEAMKNGNTLKPELVISTSLQSSMVEVEIIDNGPGIPKEIIHKILKSYFTTKTQGTGLGLSICRTLIEAHGGKLTISQHPNGGAWNKFLLPVKSKLSEI